MKRMCPICGNDIDVSRNVVCFKCRYCRQPLEAIRTKKKGKKLVVLKEKY